MEHDQGPFDETVLEMLSMEVSLTLVYRDIGLSWGF